MEHSLYHKHVQMLISYNDRVQNLSDLQHKAIIDEIQAFIKWNLYELTTNELRELTTLLNQYLQEKRERLIIKMEMEPTLFNQPNKEV